MSESRLVYSTAGNERCPQCQKTLRKCRCEAVEQRSSTLPGRILISRETKGRKGKGVTLVSGLQISGAELKLLANQLKILCSSGGTVKAGVIEIQGDHRSAIERALKHQFPSLKIMIACARNRRR
ncbi:MAG: hypothetical protein IIB72_13435 [Proteobacteria bacterium]|nr:hypothetical protein [Pseudomonadota bacterium]